MEGPRDYARIVCSAPFTFLIGPEHTKITIQSGLAHHVSQPLDHLMNNGQTRESKHRIVLLEDEDPETFIAFCEYAYTGDYTVPPSGARPVGNPRGKDRDGEQERHNRVASPVSVNSGPFKGHSRRGSDWFSENVPPPVPSPPPRSVGSLAGDAGAEREGYNDGNDDSALSKDGPEDAGDKELGSESKGDDAEGPEDGATSAAAEPQAFNAPGSSRKNKKNKRRQRAGESRENITPSLTPPWTPPEKPAEEVQAQVEDRTPPAMEVAASTTMVNDWEQAVVSTAADEDELLERRMRPVIDTSFVDEPRPETMDEGRKGNLWDGFVSLDYADHRSSRENTQAGLGPRPSPTHCAMGSAQTDNIPYLVFHAKVYVFATRYLIPALAQLCLRKLHHDLVNLSFPAPGSEYDDEEGVALTTAKGRMVLALLHFTYTKTARLEPISPTSATQLRDNELRKLVCHYAACKVRALAEYCPPWDGTMPLPADGKGNDSIARQGLQGVLDSTTELASDLVYRMM